MKKIIFWLPATYISAIASAQEISIYADQFKFHGDPEQVKIYYLSEEENEQPHWYWIIDYDYNKQTRTIIKYSKNRKTGTDYKADGYIITHNLLAYNDTIVKIAGNSYPFDKTLVKRYITNTQDGKTVIAKDKSNSEYLILRKDNTGKVVETRYYFKDSLVLLKKHEHSEDGLTIKTHTNNPHGEYLGSDLTTYDEYGNPYHNSSINSDVDDNAIIKRKYTYDHLGNFTKCVEAYNGKPNIIIVREITY